MRAPRVPSRLRVNSFTEYAATVGVLLVPFTTAFIIYFGGYPGAGLLLGGVVLGMFFLVTVLWLISSEEEWDDLGGLPTRSGPKQTGGNTQVTIAPAPKDQVVVVPTIEVNLPNFRSNLRKGGDTSTDKQEAP